MVFGSVVEFGEFGERVTPLTPPQVVKIWYDVNNMEQTPLGYLMHPFPTSTERMAKVKFEIAVQAGLLWNILTYNSSHESSFNCTPHEDGNGEAPFLSSD